MPNTYCPFDNETICIPDHECNSCPIAIDSNFELCPPMYILEQSDKDPEYIEYIQEDEDMTDNDHYYNA